MLRKSIYDDGLVTDGWISIDPSDAGVIEKLFKKNIHEGEKELMMAVLRDAVECFQTYILATKQREMRLFQEAEDWILEKNSDWFFSFENICDTLQLHPDYIRKGLLRWNEAKLNSRDVQPHAASRAKLARTRIAHTSVRFSKIA
jgi:translation initiation factor 2B subunit (eIF-2B alpha/beta/delta family)